MLQFIFLTNIQKWKQIILSVIFITKVSIITMICRNGFKRNRLNERFFN